MGTLILKERAPDMQNLTCIGFDSKKDQKVGYFNLTKDEIKIWLSLTDPTFQNDADPDPTLTLTSFLTLLYLSIICYSY